jgi:hypothetical protein
MAQRSGAQKVTGALADATGRSDDEVRLALTVAVAVAGLLAVLRVLRLLSDLGSDVLGRSRR